MECPLPAGRDQPATTAESVAPLTPLSGSAIRARRRLRLPRYRTAALEVQCDQVIAEPHAGSCPSARSASLFVLRHAYWVPYSLRIESKLRRTAVPAAPAGGGVRGWGRDGLGTGREEGAREGAEGVDVDCAHREVCRHRVPLKLDWRGRRARTLMCAVPAAPAGGGVRGWGRDGLGTGA